MSKKIKVAVIGAKGFPARGGAARSNEEIYCRLVDKCDVTVYAMSTHASKKEYHGIKQIIIKVPKHHWGYVVWYLFASAFHALLFGKYDVVHVNHLSSGFIIPLLKIRYKVLLTAHGISYEKDEKWSKIQMTVSLSFEKIGIKYSDLVVSVSKSGAVHLAKMNSNTLFIPNGVDIALSASTDTLVSEVKPTDVTFAAARIIPLKGLHDLLIAIKHVNNHIKLRVIGDLDQITSYKEHITNLSRSLDCEFTGVIEGMTTLSGVIRKSRLFVFPSHSEGMSNMLLEVAAMRVPIIASDIEQNKDVFNDQEALYFSCGDSQDLAEKITWALDHYDAMKVKALHAYNRLSHDYCWDNIAEAYYQEAKGLATSN
ncbi:MAG: glycosyltransferase family 4 protein [Fermentimonas sp.]|nr:glycosyltransferase family 4 protein [Fermentimonas sp.]